MEIVTFYKIPIGWLSNAVVVWLKLHADGIFTAIRAFFDSCLSTTLHFLMFPPFLVPVLLIFSIIIARNVLRFYGLICIFCLSLFIDYQWFYPFFLLTLGIMNALIAVAFLLKRRVRLTYLQLGELCLLAGTAIAGCLFLEPIVFSSPFILIITFMLLAWFMQKRWSVVFLTAAGFLFILNQGYWQDTVETLTLLLWSCFLCMGIGVPLGIISAHRVYFFRLLQPILDLMQTLPAFVYLIPALFFFRIGMVPGLIATLIFVLPVPIRLTQAGIASTPKELLEAVEAFGASHWQLLWKVELPHAVSAIRSSLTQTIMLSLSMVVITATVGGSGLGVKVYRALQTGNIAMGFEAGYVIVIIAIVLDRLFRPGKSS